MSSTSTAYFERSLLLSLTNINTNLRGIRETLERAFPDKDKDKRDNKQGKHGLSFDEEHQIAKAYLQSGAAGDKQLWQESVAEDMAENNRL